MYDGNRLKSVLDDALPVTHYYPWGSVYGDMGSGASLQPYKYGDKELHLTAGVARYDYAARVYFAAIPRFDRPDALAGKYTHISPYAFCANNPVNVIDPTGGEVKGVSKQDAEYIVVDMVVNSINSDDEHYVEYFQIGKTLSNRALDAIEDRFKSIGLTPEIAENTPGGYATFLLALVVVR